MSEASAAQSYDRRGLIREAYRIEGIDAGQCRSIFLDWLLGAASEPSVPEQIATLLAVYGVDAPEHPMNAVLREGLEAQNAPRGRRGGWRAKRSGGG